MIRSDFKGFLVCSLHWGDEFIDWPSAQQITFAHELIDAGVGLIIGHHPHVLQAIEEYHDGIIAYSLGNFLFDLWPEKTKKTLILNIRINKKGVVKYTTTPVYINRDYQPIIATESMKTQIYDILLRSSSKLAVTYLNRDVYKKCVLRAEKKHRYSSYYYFLKNIHRYSTSIVMQSIARTIASKSKFVYDKIKLGRLCSLVKKHRSI